MEKEIIDPLGGLQEAAGSSKCVITFTFLAGDINAALCCPSSTNNTQRVAVSQAREHAEGQVFHPAVVNQSAPADECFPLQLWVSHLSSFKHHHTTSAKQTLCRDMMEVHSTLAGGSCQRLENSLGGGKKKHLLPAGLCRWVTEVGSKSAGGKPEEDTEDDTRAAFTNCVQVGEFFFFSPRLKSCDLPLATAGAC